MASTPAIVLCDLPNLMRLPFVRGGKNFEGNLRLIGCLDNICEYAEHVLMIGDHDKVLFGDTRTYDHQNLLAAFNARNWKYASCPPLRKLNRETGKIDTFSSLDDILKETFDAFLRSNVYGHYVFISDDGDFIPEMKMCISHKHKVTLFISGIHTNKTYLRRLLYLKRLGVDVIKILDFINPAYWKVRKKSQVTMVEQPQPAEEERPEVNLKVTPLPEWITSKPSQSPIERFRRRYGESRALFA